MHANRNMNPVIQAMNLLQSKARGAFFKAITLLTVPVVLTAGLPEPDTVFHGSIALDGAFVTAAETNVVVELRRTQTGAAVATYRMGEEAGAGNSYVIRAKMESALPLTDPDAFVTGNVVWLVVRKDGTVRDFATNAVGSRGTFVALNFGDADTDGDGMSDGFETRYFGSATGGNPALDSDNDGRPNLREFLDGTNPLVADGRHPADRSPADWVLGIQEVTEYALAWKLGEPWVTEPLTIPLDYVTRASALWIGGERYAFDNEPVTTAPLWWVNSTNSSGPMLAGALSEEPGLEVAGGGDIKAALRTKLRSDAVAARHSAQAGGKAGAGVVARRSGPRNFTLHQPFTVTLTVTPSESSRAFAVEEEPPAGWLIRYVSSDGRVDSTTRKIRWGPFFGNETRTLTYELTPMTADARAGFTGYASFDGASSRMDGVVFIYPPGVVPPATLAVLPNSGGLTIRITGQPGSEVTVEGSADFAQWQSLPAVQIGASGNAEVPLDGANDARFYRIHP